MTKQEQLQRLNERQLELQAAMSASDAHASKCVKTGLSFSETYPDEYVEYTSARVEYNENEALIKHLEKEIEEETINIEHYEEMD